MIYCVEDNTEIRELVVYTLQMTGFTARGFVDGKDFFAAIKEELPELVLLDIMLPGEDGLQILKKLRASETTRTIPVIMLTAKTTEYDKVIGLDSGADDYLTKPFALTELGARLFAIIRRMHGYTVNQLDVHGFCLQLQDYKVWYNEAPISLTKKEFDIFQYL